MANVLEMLGLKRRMMQDVPMPGPISGYGGGTFNMDGSVATPVQPTPSMDEVLVNDTPPPGYDPVGIDVNGARAPVEAPPEAPRALGNLDHVIEARAAEQKLREAEKEGLLPQRTGMFGMKGTLRDVLGTIGDAFLVQGGKDPIYRPQRQKERMADALAGATADERAAIERAFQIDPDFGAEMLDKWQKTEVARRNAQSIEASRQDQSRNRLRDDTATSRNQVARWFQAAKTPEQQAFAYKMAAKRASDLGISVDDLVPSAMTEAERGVYAAGDMTVNQQEMLPRRDRALDQGDQRIGIAQQNADANTTRANRPPAGRQPRSQTELEYFQEVGRKAPKDRTQAEQDFYKKYTQGTRGGSGKPTKPSVRPAAKGRFKLVN